ncbi:hypothetical protein [Novosphingobium sp.]|uniref:hypothetical protein n=1 Tax=Novosphingobium sp. TaxID=1874826 RepID=UPI002604E613|nr:hypothetical protein [Novosphingobium sp.]
MQRIVTDEQRRAGPKSARPEGVASGGPLDSVTPLAGATSPCCAPFLASGPPDAITVIQIGRKAL